MGHTALLLQLGAGHGRGVQVSGSGAVVQSGLPEARLLCFSALFACSYEAPHHPLCPSKFFTCRLYAKPLAAAFEKRPDLRVTICHALRRLCTQNRAALAAAGQPVGHADPCAVMSGGGGDEDGLAASQEEQVRARSGLRY